MPFKAFDAPARQESGAERFAKGLISPFTKYGAMVGEAAGSLGRLAFDPIYRKAASGAKLTPAEGEYLAKLKPLFMSEADTAKFNTAGGALKEGTKRIAGVDAFLLPGGGSLGAKALSGAASGGLLGYSEGDDIDAKNIFTGAVTGGVAAPAMSLFSKAASGGVRKLSSKTGAALTDAGEKWSTRGLGNPLKQTELVKKSGIKMSDFFDEFNLHSRDPEAAAAAKRAIWNTIDDKTMNSDKMVQVGQILQGIDDRVTELVGAGGIKKPTAMAKMSPAAMSEAKALLEQKKNILKVIGATRKNIPTESPMANLATYKKKVIDENLPKNAWAITDVKQTGDIAGKKAARRLISGAMDAVDPEISKLGRKYGMAKGVEKIFNQAEARANNRQPINFTKFGGAGVGGLVAGAPGAAGMFVGEQIVNSPAGVKAVSKGFKAAGSAFSRAGLPNVSQVEPSMLAKIARKAVTTLPAAGAVGAVNTPNAYSTPVSIPKATPTPTSGFKPFPNQGASTSVPIGNGKAKLPLVKPITAPKATYGLGSANFTKVKKLGKSAAY